MTLQDGTLEKVAPPNVILTAQVEYSPRSARAIGNASSDDDTSFLSLLDTLAVPPSTDTTDTEASTLAALQNTVAQATQPQAPKKPVAKTTTTEAPQTTATVTPNPSVLLGHVHRDDDTDSDDMWRLDVRHLQASDWPILQNVLQVAPVQAQALNTLNSATVEQSSQTFYKSLGGSEALQEMLKQAYKTQRPVRVDLSETASIILRLGKDGRVSAEFMPMDQAASFFFQQNLQDLKARLDSKQLPYGQLSVRDWKQQSQQQQQQQNQ